MCVCVIDNYKTETEVKYDDRDGVVSILSRAKNSILDFYFIMKLFVSELKNINRRNQIKH